MTVDELAMQIKQMGYMLGLKSSTMVPLIDKIREMQEGLLHLRKERDKARREVLEGMHPDLRHGYATAKEWDCLEDEIDIE